MLLTPSGNWVQIGENGEAFPGLLIHDSIGSCPGSLLLLRGIIGDLMQPRNYVLGCCGDVMNNDAPHTMSDKALIAY